ncbi:MAG: hypothetical protein CM15mP127_11580 [Gammaproteobacteria bacterium]|nr:MAG: hypothetical protein CM15mP127_11580 [Gammaproteobacteria bacterium]
MTKICLCCWTASRQGRDYSDNSDTDALGNMMPEDEFVEKIYSHPKYDVVELVFLYKSKTGCYRLSGGKIRKSMA